MHHAEAREALASGDSASAEWIALLPRRSAGDAEPPGSPEALEPSGDAARRDYGIADPEALRRAAAAEDAA